MAFITKGPIFLLFLNLLPLFCSATNTITKGESIKDGETLLSIDENFELGFFSPANSTSRYVGIRHHKIEDPSVIWIANRENPISGTGGTLTIGDDGNLRVVDRNGVLIWSSNASQLLSNSTQATLQNSGNLILSGIGDTTEVYWESFEHPTDTFLPNMKILVVGENKALTSWKSATDPSPGNFSLGVSSRGAPQLVIWERTERRWRSGYWNGQIFTGVPNMSSLTSIRYGFKVNLESDRKLYVTYYPRNPFALMRFQLTWTGHERQVVWNETEKNWDLIQTQPANDCELYNFCGNFGVCNVYGDSICSCMDGFVPKDSNQWGRGNWSSGCVRRTELQCQRNSSIEDGFKELKCNKLPDFADVYRIEEHDCVHMCLNNCSCNGYAVVENIGCMIWNGDLIDVQDFGKPGIVMNLRLAGSELVVEDSSSKGLPAGEIAGIAVGGAVFLVVIALLLWRLKTKLKVLPAANNSTSLAKKSEVPYSDKSKSKGYSSDMSGQADLVIDGSPVNGPDLPLFSFSSVAAATDNFSEQNKLGQGGFGHVYKGKLPGGEEIAVKRLSKISGQGLEEFKNEIILIAKLQHRNLVRLLGCCIEGDEKILMYEYMPNKSLDFFLFAIADLAKQPVLDWRKRFEIIEGIARGLLYLHRDSRLRIIHRDLKASNILLDEEMIPKISDFGMARIFGGNQNEINTNRVVGTYGYMSPEYAMEGLFSVKSDVYSFGVLLLEIVSGRRNTSFRSTDHCSLTAYAWELWNENKAADLIDPSIRDSSRRNEVMRCIQVAMLCVQDSAVNRPTMSNVILMLESNTLTLPLPKQPTYNSMRASIDASEIFIDAQEIVSSNDLTVTMIAGR